MSVRIPSDQIREEDLLARLGCAAEWEQRGESTDALHEVADPCSEALTRKHGSYQAAYEALCEEIQCKSLYGKATWVPEPHLTLPADE